MQNPLPALAYLPVWKRHESTKLNLLSLDNVCDWVNVAVMNYVAERKLWNVLTLDGLQRKFKLPRIYLMFKAEDPTVYANRIKLAIELRNYTETVIRY